MAIIKKFRIKSFKNIQNIIEFNNISLSYGNRLILDNLDFIQFSNFSPIVATAILVSILGFFDDFIEISAFNKYIVLTFLILMLLYANSTLPIIQNLNGFLGLNNIGFIPGLIFTSFVYLSIMNAINLTDGIDGYLAIFSITFLLGLEFL